MRRLRETVRTRWAGGFLALALAAGAAPGAVNELKSGPQPGIRPLPFTSTMVTGPERGKQHCYI